MMAVESGANASVSEFAAANLQNQARLFRHVGEPGINRDDLDLVSQAMYDHVHPWNEPRPIGAIEDAIEVVQADWKKISTGLDFQLFEVADFLAGELGGLKSAQRSVAGIPGLFKQVENLAHDFAWVEANRLENLAKRQLHENIGPEDVLRVNGESLALQWVMGTRQDIFTLSGVELTPRS